jgi:glycosyltransferase involved in cell wall biosynthesis
MESLRFLLSTTFYPPYHVGGDAVHVKYLAEELMRRGHEVHVFYSLDAYRVKRKSFSETVERDGIYTYPIKTRFNLSSYAAYILGNSSLITRKFDRLINEIKPDVVHHHNISLLGHGLLKKRRNYLNFFTAHDYWLVCQQNNLLKDGSETCERRREGSCFFCALKCGRPPQIWRSFRSLKTAIEGIDLMICPSNYVRRRLSEEIDVKSVTLPNFAPSPPKNIPSASHSHYFLFVGMLEIHKGILNLLQLFKELRREINARLVVVGDGNLKKDVIDFIKRNSLNGFVSYKGFVDVEELYSLYKNALALVIPSIWPENAPLTALEALSVGTPVTASNTGGLPEIVGKVDKKLIFDDWIGLKNILLGFRKSKFPPKKTKEVYERNFSPNVYVYKYIAIIRALSTKQQIPHKFRCTLG